MDRHISSIQTQAGSALHVVDETNWLQSTGMVVDVVDVTVVVEVVDVSVVDVVDASVVDVVDATVVVEVVAVSVVDVVDAPVVDVVDVTVVVEVVEASVVDVVDTTTVVEVTGASVVVVVDGRQLSPVGRGTHTTRMPSASRRRGWSALVADIRRRFEPSERPARPSGTLTGDGSLHTGVASLGSGGTVSPGLACAVERRAGAQVGLPGTLRQTARANVQVPFGVPTPSRSQLGSQSVQRTTFWVRPSARSPGIRPSRAIRQSFAPSVCPCRPARCRAKATPRVIPINPKTRLYRAYDFFMNDGPLLRCKWDTG